ncbi:integrase catalytic subunit (plasmid) [Gloeothece citriformis PCC 7424]|uniref:Integrase catalytic subunit n=1 Tax=Gloeothece citriformis (strain PCC 7424) TaxID=65393 RepID=B7KM38_GLOC7|nr:helix-turn-helix domain-containing protein [Gloeothece citriformis]ACK73860.1 integrase catalytic subunit [Gloeothece citriformis PCC 7424]
MEPKSKRQIIEFTQTEKEKIEAVKSLLAAQDKTSYRQRQKEIAQKLGISQRSVQRMVKAWQDKGVSGLTRNQREDKGKHRITQEWEEYILKTYREGNRGSLHMSRAQVALRVEARAATLGEEDYPSRATVYRVLSGVMESQTKIIRSLGWKGEKLILKSREGIEIEVEYSNQVWQCDHTKVDVFVVDRQGEILGRPWLTTVIDSYSRCIMGIYLGMETPSAAIVALALRHGILPKQDLLQKFFVI